MITAALVGNPNSGKTTIFNKLTGSNQHVGNWPGVTVEKKEGFAKNASGERIRIVDLPGIYSLSPFSPEEVISRDYLVGNSADRPDVVVNILDASNLERGMYLYSQVADMGIPAVVVLNMADVAENKGLIIDADRLSEALGCEVVKTVGTKSMGTDAILCAMVRTYQERKVPKSVRYTDDIEECASGISEIIKGRVRDDLVRWSALKIIERDERVLGDLGSEISAEALSLVEEFERKVGDDGTQQMACARYAYGESLSRGALVKRTAPKKDSGFSDNLDKVLLDRRVAIPFFIVVMYIVYFFSIQTVGTWGSDFINDTAVVWVQEHLGEFMADAGVDEILIDLVVTGIVGGVGAVIGFLPQILVLFLCLCILEECGYMARVAYVLDRIFVRFGLSGKAIIPAVIGIGCGVPAIMGTRTIEDESNRNISAMCTTFMPCSAKLPILTVIISAFFGESALVTLSLYLLGILMILISGLFLKKFRGFVGKPSPFIMELPEYHCPVPRNVIIGVGEKSWAFVRKAGTIILLSAVLIWALSSFDWSFEYLGDSEINGSILASLGQAVTWIFLPNGFGEYWEFTVASVTGLMAKENLLATVAVLLDAAVDEEGIITSEALALFCSSGIAMSFLIFNLLCAPCFAAIGAMHRELGSWSKTLMAVLYQCCTAYAVSTIYYQFWCLFNGEVGVGIVLALVFIAIPVYVILSKKPFGKLFDREEKEAVQ